MKVRKWVSILNSSEKTGKPGKINGKKNAAVLWIRTPKRGAMASSLPTELAGL